MTTPPLRTPDAQRETRADRGGDDDPPSAITRLLREEAARAGFHRFGVGPATPWPRYDRYAQWLAGGGAGEMRYLVEQAAPRRDVRQLLAGARSVITVGLAYAHADTAPARDTPGRPRAFIARYARGPDYHQTLKRRLRRMADSVGQRLGHPFAWLACVDTAPVLEREAAHRGGVGFFARNTMIIAPGLGSYLLLGELLTDLDAAPTDEAQPRCGRCRACLDACPTAALTRPFELDARRCISYLTIEHRGPIPRALRPALENMVFGCDRCQEVCPFNASPAVAEAPALAPARPLASGRDAPALVELLGLGAARFRKFVQGTALRRIHRAQLLRNVVVALGNVGGPGDVSPLAAALAEPSPLVRAHVAWALGRIAARFPSSAARAALETHRPGERDAEVREEIDLALADPVRGAPAAP